MLKNEDISLGQKRFHEQKGKEKFGKASQTGLVGRVDRDCFFFRIPMELGEVFYSFMG
jgi:hypothetical protein